MDRRKRLIPWKQHEQRSSSPPFTWRNWDFVPLSGKNVKLLKIFVGYARISRILEASKCSRDRRTILCIIIGWKHDWSVLDCSLSRDCEDNRIHRLVGTNMSIRKLLSTSVWRAHRGTPNSSESILTLMKIQKRTRQNGARMIWRRMQQKLKGRDGGERAVNFCKLLGSLKSHVKSASWEWDRLGLNVASRQL